MIHIPAPPHRRLRALPFALAALTPLMLTPALALDPAPGLAPAPEVATGRGESRAGQAQRHMVAAANPIAAQVGRDILRAGGSATDAAIAIQLALNLVEPQSSGIGGGAFILHWDGNRRVLATLDGRETAPAAATPDRFLKPDGEPMAFMEAVVGGRSVGVPGTVRLLADAHARWGRLPWASLFEPAIRIAEEGFPVSPRLHGQLEAEKALRDDPRARAYFYQEDGSPKPVGETLTSPAMARTLRAIAQGGADAFYTGEIAQDIVATVTGHPNAGDITAEDLARYETVERPPVCGRYRVYTICGMGPPSSGAIAVNQILAVLETRDMAGMGPGPEAVHWFSEAGRLAFADRGLYVADPEFVDVPVRGLTDGAYNRDRAGAIDPQRSMGKAEPGEPPFRRAMLLAPASPATDFGTSHISVVDSDGNAVSMTTTIEAGFGARLMTEGGFLLNNELTDFSFTAQADGRPIANRVEPGKRPRSSMAPTIAFDAFDRLYLVTGSPGGSQIINYVAKTLVGILDFGMEPQTAIDMPNFGSRNGPTEIEAGTAAEEWKAALEDKGHEVRVMDMTSGIQAIVVTPSGLLGGADPRREGVAIGD